MDLDWAVFVADMAKVAPMAGTVAAAILVVTLPWSWAAGGRPMLAVERDSRPVEPADPRSFPRGNR